MLDRLSTIGGGLMNSATGDFTTVPGGICNTASGNFSVAIGVGARANHEASIVLSANPPDNTYGCTDGNSKCVSSGPETVSVCASLGFFVNGVDLMAKIQQSEVKIQQIEEEREKGGIALTAFFQQIEEQRKAERTDLMMKIQESEAKIQQNEEEHKAERIDLMAIFRKNEEERKVERIDLMARLQQIDEELELRRRRDGITPAPKCSAARAQWRGLRRTARALRECTRPCPILFLDARAKESYDLEHSPCTVNIPHSELEARISDIVTLAGNKGSPIALHSGTREGSNVVQHLLVDNGFTDVTNVGGWNSDRTAIDALCDRCP
jgi:rhodanese-related sulfurtransferase